MDEQDTPLDLDQQKAVAAGLNADGLNATVEFPGCVSIELDDQTTVCTGLHGWEYGTIYRLDADTMDGTDETAQPDGLTEGVGDVPLIVAAWAEWVRRYRADAG